MRSRSKVGVALLVSLGCLSAERLPAQISRSQIPGSRNSRASGLEFELRAESGNAAEAVVSRAVLTPSALRIISRQDGTTEYRRESRWDSQDGRWLGYSSSNAGQVIRWPADHRGHLQIGRSDGSEIVFRPSRMNIYPLAAANNSIAGGRTWDANRSFIRDQRPDSRFSIQGRTDRVEFDPFFDRLLAQSERVNDNPVSSQMLRLASFAGNGAPMLLSRMADSALGVVTSAGGSSDWLATPAGNGYLRLMSYDRGSPLAMAVNAAGELGLAPMSQHPRQLWRVAPGRVRNRYVLESVAFPGRCLTYASGGTLVLQPIAFAPPQLWSPLAAPLRPAFQPFWRTVSTQVTANPPLPPAEIELLNTHKYALVVLLGDSRDAWAGGQQGAVQQLRIEPNTGQVVELERDAGATLVETVEVRSASGLWDRREFVTEIPPQNFYDLSVYEEHLQSIAIDATGKSPNPIEDVNYVPKSVGWLPLPGGADLPDYLQIDLYAKALAANNPGAVRRLDPRQFEEKADDNPLETILEKFQTRPRRKF